MYQIATGTCPAAFTNATAGQKLLLPFTQGSGGVKALYFAVPGIVRACGVTLQLLLLGIHS